MRDLPSGRMPCLPFTRCDHSIFSVSFLLLNVSGNGFYGPVSIIAKAMQVTQYPLTFRPAYEATIEGCLTLENKADCHEHIFELIGRALEPLPLERITIKGAVNQPWSRIIDVPNVTKRKLVYRVGGFSIVSGNFQHQLLIVAN